MEGERTREQRKKKGRERKEKERDGNILGINYIGGGCERTAEVKSEIPYRAW